VNSPRHRCSARLSGTAPSRQCALVFSQKICAATLPAFAHGVPTVFRLPMIVAAAQGEVLLDPDDLGPTLQPASSEVGSHNIAVQCSMPDIGDIPSKQRIGLPPLGAIVVKHFALGQLAGTDATARSPTRIIVDAIRRICDHHVRLRSRQHPLDIRCASTVAAADPVVSREPYVSGPSDGIFGYLRGAVWIGQTTRPQTGQDVFKPIWLEADQFEVETVEFEITQLTAEQIGVPARPRRKFIVGQAIGLLLLFAPLARDDHWGWISAPASALR